MEIRIPTLLRIKPGALQKIGKYLRSAGFRRIALCWGEGMRPLLSERVSASLDTAEIQISVEREIRSNEIEGVVADLLALPDRLDAVVAIGGGKVIDYCKYLAFLRQLPVLSVPTSIAHDGMASPTASLMAGGRRRTFKARIPYGVVMDTEVIARSPRRFSLSGLGDMVSKFTAAHDWKLAYHETGEPVNDFAVLVSMQSVQNLAHYPKKDLAAPGFLDMVCGSLVMSGVAMEISGSSRPASGSEHLISHAYDVMCPTPTLHGLQVGVASYAVAWLQDNLNHGLVTAALEESGFLAYVKENPLDRRSFVEAIRKAPSVKPGMFTVLSRPGEIERLIGFVESDPLMNELAR